MTSRTATVSRLSRGFSSSRRNSKRRKQPLPTRGRIPLPNVLCTGGREGRGFVHERWSFNIRTETARVGTRKKRKTTPLVRSESRGDGKFVFSAHTKRGVRNPIFFFPPHTYVGERVRTCVVWQRRSIEFHKKRGPIGPTATVLNGVPYTC